MQDRLRHIERLREYRARPERETAIGPMIENLAAGARRTQKRLGELIDLWEQLLPADLATRTVIESLRGGTLHVRVDSSPTAYELDRRLREGLEQELRRQYRGTLRRVKVRIGSPE